ncbi:MAG: urease subunit beta [Chloroflexi bacterium]|nr:urease subunit beta [Chloroflexota bacterium]
MIPGEIWPAEATLVLNDGRAATELDVENTGDRPVQVGSHFHFFEVNRALQFERAAAFGRRLDIPSGTAVRFEPGERQRVQLILLQGRRQVRGFNGLVNGPLDSAHTALQAARDAGFGGA